ncbi:MAG: hypothetical protein ACRCTY_04425, partial [Candidatus Adiutrix sp.]
MGFNLEKVEEQLNAISLDLMMISTDNLLEFSDILGKIEGLSPFFAPLESDLPAPIIGALEETLKGIICGQINDVSQATIEIGRGLTILQELAQALPVKAPFKTDVPGWINSLTRLISSEGVLSAAFGSGPEMSLPPNDTTTNEAPETIKATPVPSLNASALGNGGPVLPESLAPQTGPNTVLDPSPEEFESLETLSPPHLADDKFDDQIELTFSADPFKKEFSAAVETLQVLIVAIEQRSEPHGALSDLSRSFHSLLGGISLLGLENLATIISSTTDFIDYVALENVPYSTAITDILLSSCDFLLKGLNSLIIDPSTHTFQTDPTVYEQGDLDLLLEHLWMARQGIMPTAAPEQVLTSSNRKPKKIGEILIEKGLIAEGDLGGLIEAQNKVRNITIGEILLADNLITPDDLEDAL